MLECGPSVLAGLKRCGLPSDLPDAVLLSHLHGDHFGGLPFLFMEYLFENPRSRPITIAGPRGTEERVAALYKALYSETQCRVLGFSVNYVVVEPGDRLTLAGFEVEAFEVPHSAMPYSLGYRIVRDGEAILFSGDSAWTDEFIERSRGTRLFLCECCTMERVMDIHTAYADIVEHREALHCERLLLTHLGGDVRAADDLDADRAYDGMVVEIGDDVRF